MSSCINSLFRSFSQGTGLTDYERLKKHDEPMIEINYHGQIVSEVSACSEKLLTMSEKEMFHSAKKIRDAFVKNVRLLGKDSVLDEEATQIFNRCVKPNPRFGKVFFGLFVNVDQEMKDAVPDARASMSKYCWVFAGYGE